MVKLCAALAATLILAACGGQARGPGGSELPEPDASANLFDTSGTRVGLVTFADSGGGAQLGISVSGLEPGLHGMHIHENGACDPPKFESAGGHFNPDAKQHGSKNPQGPHAGDLPNLMAGDDGSADTTLTVSGNLLAEGPGSMVGAQKRAFVIHADPDDEMTDPSGSSGDRVVCGVIERR